MALGLAALAALSLVAGEQPGWERVLEHAAFSPRDTAEDAVFHGRLWLSNGYYHGNVLTRDLWSSPDGLAWTRVSEATPYDGYSELVNYHDKLWAIKGSVWSSPDGETWTKVLDRTPFGIRGYGECVVFHDCIWQLGCGDDVWSTTDGVNWVCELDDAPFGNRAAAAVTVFQDHLWLLGGRTGEPNDPPEKGYAQFTTHHDVWRSADGRTWERVLEAAPWAPRQWFPAVVYRDRIWLIGGHDNVNSANLGDVWWSTDGVAWTQHGATPVFSPRHEPTPYVFDGSLWIVAGNSWPVQNDVWRLTLPAE